MRIKLYNEKNETVIYNVNVPFARGGFGIVYRLDNVKCLKCFYSNNLAKSIDVMRDIRELRLDNYYQIYDFLFDNNGDFCGYEMKYYQGHDIDIMTMSTEYSIENLRKIAASFRRLNEKRISVVDLNKNNVILDHNNIIVIDTDLYRRCYCSSDELMQMNNDALCRLFINLYYYTMKEKHSVTLDDMRLLRELFDSSRSIDEISKKLSKYKYPIDYMYKCRGR